MTPLLFALVLTLGGGNNDGRNENGRDCYQASAECSDDDSVTIAPVVCVQPGSCRFGMAGPAGIPPLALTAGPAGTGPATHHTKAAYK